MTSQKLYKEFLKEVLKEEKLKLSKNELEILFQDTYLHAFDTVIDGVHDAQTDFVA